MGLFLDAVPPELLGRRLHWDRTMCVRGAVVIRGVAIRLKRPVRRHGTVLIVWSHLCSHVRVLVVLRGRGRVILMRDWWRRRANGGHGLPCRRRRRRHRELLRPPICQRRRVRFEPLRRSIGCEAKWVRIRIEAGEVVGVRGACCARSRRS
jgi:hypothetical protein